jgi:ankyrin repeat protein
MNLNVNTRNKNYSLVHINEPELMTQSLETIDNSMSHIIIASLPGSAGQHLLDIVCQEGPMAITHALFADPRLDVSEKMNAIIQVAACNGQCEVVQLLLKNKRVNLRPNGHFALIMSARSGDLYAVRRILADKTMDWEHGKHHVVFKDLLFDASRLGRIEMLRFFLQDGRVLRKRSNPELLITSAADKGHCEVVHLLFQDNRINKGLHLNFVFYSYCNIGDTDKVRALLTNPKMYPPWDRNSALQVATARGHVDVMKLLLGCSRVILLSTHAHELVEIASSIASKNGYVSVMKLLLSDSRVNPSVNSNSAVVWACIRDSAYVVGLLLADSRVIASGGERSAIMGASRWGSHHVLRMLMSRPGVVVTKGALVVADKNDRMSVIDIFIAEQPRVVWVLCSDGGIVCKRDGVLRVALDRWETRTALNLLLCVKRTHTRNVAGRMSDVLREVLSRFTKFNVIMENKMETSVFAE